MKLSINGESILIDNNGKTPSLIYVIQQLELNPQLIVVEFNGEIINSKKWTKKEVNEGDILEIVTIVGGG